MPSPDARILNGLRVTVMGLGTFGGGRGVVDFLLQQGARVTLTDLRRHDELADSLQRLDLSRLSGLALGEHRDEDFRNAELVVVNPAVRPDGNRFLQIARDAGVPLTSEMNLFWERCAARKIAVTGTVGKSTTATLIHRLLLAAGFRSRLGGNIGISLLPDVASIAPQEWVVLELSSYQLHALNGLRPQPDISVVTNFSPNHLTWHGSLAAYREAKQSILRWQTSAQAAVLPAMDPEMSNWPTAAQRYWYHGQVGPDHDFSRTDPPADKISLTLDGRQIQFADEELAGCLQHPHTRRHASAALTVWAIVEQLSATADFRQADARANALSAVREALKTFTPLPHRLQEVATVDGRLFLNDSKATTPQATIAALRAVSSRPIWLITGGTEPRTDLALLAQEIPLRVRGAALLGQTGGPLARLLTAAGEEYFPAANLTEAVAWTWKQSSPGDVVLLSPGCASQPDFQNYEQRGEEFVRLITDLESGPCSTARN